MWQLIACLIFPLQIAMVSPSEMDYEESICTLRYASRVKYIKNHTHINVETKQGLIECFEKEIEELQKRIMTITVQEEKTLKAVSCSLLMFYSCRYQNIHNRKDRNIVWNVLRVSNVCFVFLYNYNNFLNCELIAEITHLKSSTCKNKVICESILNKFLYVGLNIIVKWC